MKISRCSTCSKIRHATEACLQKHIIIPKHRRAVQNKLLENNSQEKSEQYDQPTQQVGAVEDAALSLTANRDAEEDVLSKRQKVDKILHALLCVVSNVNNTDKNPKI